MRALIIGDAERAAIAALIARAAAAPVALERMKELVKQREKGAKLMNWACVIDEKDIGDDRVAETLHRLRAMVGR